jgi:hypothetical protein
VRAVKVHEIRFPTKIHRFHQQQNNQEQPQAPVNFQSQQAPVPPQQQANTQPQQPLSPTLLQTDELMSPTLAPPSISISNNQTQKNIRRKQQNSNDQNLGKRAIGRLLAIQKMNAGDFFGETGTFSISKRQGLGGMQSKEIWKSSYSVITNMKCTLLILNKIDLINICSDDNFEKLRKDVESRQVSHQEIIESYSGNLKWEQFRQEAINEVVLEQLSRKFADDLASEEHKLKIFSGFCDS